MTVPPKTDTAPTEQRVLVVEDDPAKPRYIQTVWGFGYVFVPDDQKGATEANDTAAHGGDAEGN